LSALSWLLSPAKGAGVPAAGMFGSGAAF